MQAYQKTISDGHAASFSACIELLSQTAVLIKFFNDKRPVNSTDDHRISDLKRVLDWFKSWGTSAALAKELVSSECKQDLTQMIIGMESLVKLATEEWKTAFFSYWYQQWRNRELRLLRGRHLGRQQSQPLYAQLSIQ